MYMKKHSIFIMKYYLQFRVSTGVLECIPHEFFAIMAKVKLLDLICFYWSLNSSRGDLIIAVRESETCKKVTVREKGLKD